MGVTFLESDAAAISASAGGGIERRRSVVAQLGRFALVSGCIGTLSTVIFLVARIWWDPLPANFVAVVVSTTVSTELHRRFTFSGSPASRWRMHVQTVAVALYYAFAGSAVLVVLGLPAADTNPVQELVAVSVAGVLAALGRFVVLRSWVHRDRTTTSAGAARSPATDDLRGPAYPERRLRTDVHTSGRP